MLVSIDKLRPDSAPVRKRLWDADDASLRASIAELGVLEPLLVVRLGDDFDDAPEYEVKDGNRRLAAAKAQGLMALEVAELPRSREDFTLAAATAANLVRAPLDPIDQWRAIVALQERGYSLAGAAACLGMPERQAMQLDKLGRLHPDMLKLIEDASDWPTERQLAEMAAAPLDVQQKAAVRKGVTHTHGDGELDVYWHMVAERCRRQRFPKATAIFDAEASGLAWEQDVFAQPGSPDEWTTADAKGFLAAQRAALKAQADASKGKLVMGEESPRYPGTVQLPKGWKESYGSADKPKRNETVFAIVSGRTGQIVRQTATNPAAEKAAAKEAEAKAKAKAKEAEKKAKEKAKKAAPAAAVPSALGTVETPIGGATAGGAGDAAPGTGAPAEDGEEEEAAPAIAAPARHPLNKNGLKILAGYKTEALRKTLRDPASVAAWPLDKLLALLILALHAPNVSISHYDRSGDDLHLQDGGRDLVVRLITPAGHLQYDEAELPRLAAEAIARTLSFSPPDEPAGHYGKRSGDTAEWVGAAIGAGWNMPRLDTKELLETLDSAALRTAAGIAEHKFTTAGAAKRDLVGKVNDWSPPWAQFGAPGPKVKVGDRS